VTHRRRPALDWGLRFALTGGLFLVPAAALGLAFALGLAGGPRLGLAYAVLALGGWVTFTIAGMMLKIVPFLVWYRAYAPRVGRTTVPTLAELSWPAGERAAYALLTAGVPALAFAAGAGDAAAITVTGSAVAAGACVFAVVIARIVHHLVPCPLRRGSAPLVKPS